MLSFNRSEQPQQGEPNSSKLKEFLKGSALFAMVIILDACATQTAVPQPAEPLTPTVDPSVLTETATVPPTAIVPTETATPAPTKTEIPKDVFQLFVMSEAAGGPSVVSTPEGSSVNSIGKNDEFFAEVTRTGSTILEKLKAASQGLVGKFFVFYGLEADMVDENTEIDHGTYTILDENGLPVFSVTQTYTIELGSVKDASGADVKAITNFEVGNQTPVEQYTPEYIETLRLKAEKKLGISIDPEKFHVGANYKDGVLVVGVEATNEQTKTVSLAIPAVDSIVGDRFEGRIMGIELDESTVIELTDLLEEEAAPQVSVEPATTNEITAFYGNTTWTTEEGKKVTGTFITSSKMPGVVRDLKENGEITKIKEAMIVGRVKEVVSRDTDSYVVVDVEYKGRTMTILFVGFMLNDKIMLYNPQVSYNGTYPVDGTQRRELFDDGWIKPGEMVGFVVDHPLSFENTHEVFTSTWEAIDQICSDKDIDPALLEKYPNGFALIASGVYVPDLVQAHPNP